MLGIVLADLPLLVPILLNQGSECCVPMPKVCVCECVKWEVTVYVTHEVSMPDSRATIPIPASQLFRPPFKLGISVDAYIVYSCSRQAKNHFCILTSDSLGINQVGITLALRNRPPTTSGR
jgi:hypothetical protein